MRSSAAASVAATPLLALAAFGLGPMGGSTGSSPAANLKRDRGSATGLIAAIDSSGFVVRQLLAVLAAFDHRLTAGQLAFQTAGAAPGVIDEAIDRMQVADLVRRTKDGGLTVSPELGPMLRSTGVSLADQNAITTDALAQMLRTLGLPAASRKQDRIDAIAAVFADPTAAAEVRAGLSAGALVLLDRIVRAAGPASTDSERVGLPRHVVITAAPARYASLRRVNHPTAEVLHELTSRGIVGVGEYEGTLWVWKEAWPLVGVPFYPEWPHVEAPRMGRAVESAPSIPKIVPTIDRMLSAWQTTPAPVLKNDEPRIGKADVKALAKSCGVDEATVDLAARLAIAIGLVLRNVLSESGRGRQRRVEQGWMPDPSLVAAWRQLPAQKRWVRLLAEWCRPTTSVGQQRLANRHLVLWELANLADGDGIVDERAWATWFEHRYGTMGVAEAVAECLAELRALGVVTSSGPTALTAMARVALADPAGVDSLFADESTHATVQADLTVVAPPGLRHDLAARLATIAEIESDAGVTVYRLDADRITRAVQAGETPEAIVAFLTALSDKALPDVVTRLVRDGATRAGKVQLLSAPTVLVVTDPADLVTACSVKSARLTPVSATVAVSDLPYAKVRAALDRKGLVADVTLGATTTRTARSSADSVADLERRAASYRQFAQGQKGSMYDAHVRSLEAQARALADPGGRLEVNGPLALTPALAATLDR